MANWIITDSVNLRQPTHYAHGAVAEDLMLPGDNKAHTWEVTIRDGDADADLSGKSCYAYFVRKDNTKVLVNGTITGNVCSVTLHSTCYAVPGFIRAVMILSATGETTAIYEKTFRVNPALPDQTVDPGETIPSLDDLLAEIGAMRLATSETIAATNAARAATTAANTATQNANAKAEAAQTAANNANQATTAANQATANANTATQNANAKAEQAQTAANNADQATTAATAATAAAQTATTDANNAAQNANTAASTITNQIDRLDAVDRKQNARLSNLEAASEGYLYNVVEDSETAYSKTVPDGTLPYANLDMVGGKTLVWNQYSELSRYTKGNITNLVPDGENKQVPASVVGNYYTAVIPDAFKSNPVPGHKYFISFDTKSSKVYNCGVGVGSYAPIGEANKTPDVWEHVAIVNTTPNVISYGTHFYLFTNATPRVFTEEDYVAVKNVKVVNLTVMFGAGNEPTVEQFEAMFPADYYPYSEPTLMSFSADKVVSKGRNLLDTIGIYNREMPKGSDIFSVDANGYVYVNKTTTDRGASFNTYIELEPGTYTISLKVISGIMNTGAAYTQYDRSAENGGAIVLTSTRKSSTFTVNKKERNRLYVCYAAPSFAGSVVLALQIEKNEEAMEYAPYRDPITTDLSALVQKYFPDGMKSAGDVHDEIDLERGVAIQRVGSVDLGKQPWNPYVSITDRNIYSSGTITGMKPAQAKSTCAEYTWRRWDALNVMAELEVWTHPSLPYAYICDSRYTNGSEFRNAVSGVLFYYELATPVETPIDPADLADLAVLNVEAGGSLTFANDNGDDYRVPMPNQETFMIKLGGEQA